MENRFVSPTERGQITIPKEVREQFGISPKTKFRVYVDNKRVVLKPVSSLELLFRDIELEARETREEKEIEVVRERLMKELYGNGTDTA